MKNSTLFRCICVIFAIVIYCCPLKGQLYNFRSYSLDEGLSQSEVNCLYEDSRGYLWIGTAGGGICRFDGKDIIAYEEQDALCGQIVSSISEDASRFIVVGGQNGRLCRFNGKKFSPIPLINSNLNNSIKFTVNDEKNNTVIVRDNQVLVLTGTKIQQLPIQGDPIGDFVVNCVKKDSRNTIWIGTNKGLLVLKNEILVKINNVDFINQSTITSLAEDMDGTIWAVEDYTTFYKINIIDQSHYQVKVKKIDTIALPNGTLISDILFDKKQQLWIATKNKGVFKFSTISMTHFNQSNGFPVDNVNNVFEDKSGNVWFGTKGGGLVKFVNQAFTYFNNVAGLKENDVFSMIADKKGSIWIGTSSHGIYKYDGTTVTNITTASKVGDVEIRSMYCDKKGNVWIGTTKGIIKYDGSFHPIVASGCENIRVISEDQIGNIWIGTKGNGVFIYNGTSFKQLTEKEGLSNQNVYSFVQEKNGTIWLGTGGGISIYNNGKIIKQYGVTDGLCNSYTGSMVIDKFGKIWIGTDNCVVIFDGKKFNTVTTKDGLASGIIYLINKDNNGNIWVGTNKGLDEITLTKNGAIESIRNYGKDEGLKGIECNSRATTIDKNGHLWFGTVKGVIKFDPKENYRNKAELPLIHITDIRLFYHPVDWKKYSDTLTYWYNLPVNLILAHNENHLTFDFSAINKSLPENIKYSFKLNDFDNDWSPYAAINSTTYSNLPPGKYKFLVKAKTKTGEESVEPAEFYFSIEAPFWTTWWFITTCLVGFFGILYGQNFYRKRKHQLYLEELENIIKERTIEIIKQRDENVILLKEVHHRVKNNLQIISSLINIQSEYVVDPKAIELFREICNRIRTISLVHEKLYKSTDYGHINVKEYINMLVENLIDTFSINKNIKLKMDLEVQHFNLNTIIPLGLLLNEVISNAFKYAFKEIENGVIEIELRKSAITSEYTLVIGDNGKGYDQKLLNSENPTLGLELIKILSMQLNGTIEKLEKPGTYYKLRFTPIKD